MRNADVIAIDAPFGWPEFMNAHLGEYAARGVWPLRPKPGLRGLPGGSARELGLPFKGYKPGSRSSEKTKRAREKREEIADTLAAKAAWLRRTDYSDLRDDLVDDDDLLDAFVSSLAARAADIGRTVPPHTDEERRLAASEGWIHVPQERSLGGLV